MRRIKGGRQKSESETHSLLRDCENQIHEKKERTFSSSDV